jgi:DegV family protein with EDD domain
VIDTLDYLRKGGRCSAIEYLAASLLKIRPVIEVRGDGTLGVREKIGGSRKKALLSMVDEMKTHGRDIDTQRIFITHCACPEDAEYLKSEIESLKMFREVFITEAGSTIASHCGPKTIGILYLTK